MQRDDSDRMTDCLRPKEDFKGSLERGSKKEKTVALLGPSLILYAKINSKCFKNVFVKENK